MIILLFLLVSDGERERNGRFREKVRENDKIKQCISTQNEGYEIET